jgi:hypothetical protein
MQIFSSNQRGDKKMMSWQNVPNNPCRTHSKPHILTMLCNGNPTINMGFSA